MDRRDDMAVDGGCGHGASERPGAAAQGTLPSERRLRVEPRRLAGGDSDLRVRQAQFSVLFVTSKI